MSSARFSIVLNEDEKKALVAAEKLFFSDADYAYAHKMYLQLIMQHPNLGSAEQLAKLKTYFDEAFSSDPHEYFNEQKQKLLQDFAGDLLNESTQISNNEKSKLLRILHNRLFYTEEDRNAALESLQFYSPYTIFRLASASESFKAFCLSSQLLADTWGSILRDSGQLGETLFSIDKKIQLPIYNQYIGTFILDELEYSKKFSSDTEDKKIIGFDEKILDLACDLGLYQALVFRCQLNIDKLVNRFIDKIKLHYEIEHDTKMFAVYWSVGYFRAAQVLAILAESFVKQKDNLLAEKYFREALVAFAKAYLLENHSVSIKIANLYHNSPDLPAEDDTVKSFLANSPFDLSHYQDIKREVSRKLQL